MKFFVCFTTIIVYLGIAAAGKHSIKYLTPNYATLGAATSSSQYPHHHDHHYTAVASTPVHASAQYGLNRAAAQIPILRSDYNNDGYGNYHFGFETDNGIKRDETGHLQGSLSDGSLNVAGSYSYTGDDGKLYSVNYKADSNGFRAEGDHLPTPPPIPPEIQESLHLHQHGARQQVSTGHYTIPSSYSAAGGNHSPVGNFAAASHQFATNIRAPNANYLPSQQDRSYNYGKYH